jgi:hypothetical protein
MMRESRFSAVDTNRPSQVYGLSYLESSIGKTGLLAIKPMCPRAHKDLWQLYMLGK